MTRRSALFVTVTTCTLGLIGHLLAQGPDPKEIRPFRSGSVAAGGASPFAGTWTYRSFHSNPELAVPFNDLFFGKGVMKLELPASDRIRGTLGGDGWELQLAGGVTHGNPATIRFQGKGVIDGEEWVYDYIGYLVPVWPNGVDQRPAIVGTIVRTVPHRGNGGQANAGYVAQWIAVRQD